MVGISAVGDSLQGYDTLTDEVKRACLRLADEARFTPQRYADQRYFHIELPSQNKFFRVAYREYLFLSLLDGTTSFAQALALVAQELGSDSLSESEAQRLVDFLLENGIAFYTEAEADGGSRTRERQVPIGKTTPWWQRCNPFWMKFACGGLLANPDRLLDRLLPSFRWWFHPVTVMLTVLLIGMGMMAAALHGDRIWSESNGIFAGSNWISLVAIWIGLKLIHELAHGLTCRYFGGSVRETGVILILCAPMAYVDVTSSWRFPSRWRRMAVAIAGIHVELTLAAICLFAWFMVSSDVLKQQLLNVILAASVSTVLFNANPLMRFDGYYLLSDWLKIPNLYTSSSESVRRLGRWILFGERGNDSGVEIQHRPVVIRVYGVLALAWRVVIYVGLTLAASVLFGGWGIVLAVAGVISWVGRPVWQFIKNVDQRRNQNPHKLIRAGIVSTSGIGLALAAWFWVPNPFPPSAPCVVDYQEDAVVRAEAAGFVAEVMVSDGQSVAKGDPLLRLVNPELQSRIEQLRFQLETHLVRERIALDQQDAAEAQLAFEDQRATQAMLEELSQEQDQLLVRAPVAGRVVAAQLESSLGTYVDSGDLLLQLDNDSFKQIVLSIEPRDAMQIPVGQTPRIALRIGSRPLLTARLEKVEPRATQDIPHDSLIAVNGGSLVVREQQEGDQSRHVLVQPRFVAYAQLDPQEAKQLKVGERGYGKLQAGNVSLGQWIWFQTKDWIKRQLETVQQTQSAI